MSAIRGSCLCRGVGYRVEGPLDPLPWFEIADVLPQFEEYVPGDS